MNQQWPSTKDAYDLLEKIGEGAYGQVYKAIERSSQKIVAIKIINLEQDWLPLLAEINMVIDLFHKTIVNYYAFFFDGGRLWLVMEYCDGGSLSDIMKTLKRPLNEIEISAICKGVLQSLDYVHSLNRIHRDIKAGNLLLTSEGEVKLCDFGVSAQLDNSLSRTGTRIGSPYWMAPEVIEGTKGHNTKADIWSFGITALELKMGHPPLIEMASLSVMMQIPVRPPPEAPPDSSALFKKFIQRILIKDPELRPTAHDLLTDPFITQTGTKSTEIVRDLVSKYKEQFKLDNPNDGEYADEEEEEEEEEYNDGDFAQSFTPDAAATILYSGGDTFVASGTMVVSDDNAAGPAKPNSDLAGWNKLEFLDKPVQQPQFNQGKKPKFGNYNISQLTYMLQSIKKVAESELAEGKIDPKMVRSNYEGVRREIVAELQKKNKSSPVPDDYEILP